LLRKQNSTEIFSNDFNYAVQVVLRKSFIANGLFQAQESFQNAGWRVIDELKNFLFVDVELFGDSHSESLQIFPGFFRG